MLIYKKLHITCENKTASQWYMEDIYFFEVNTKFISSSVLKPSKFS